MSGVLPPAVLSLFHIHPVRIDGTAMFARALSIELGLLGFRSVLCFPSPPIPAVRDFLEAPNVTILAQPAVFDACLIPSGRSFLGLVRRHRPAVVHLHFMGSVSPLPWLARAWGVERFFFTDHESRPEVARATQPPTWKRLARTAIQHPVDRFVVVSDYVLRSQLATGHLPVTRLQLIYNGIDIERVSAAARAAGGFRSRFGIPEDRVLITQVSWLIEEKGVADLIEAAKLVLGTCPKAHFCIAGTGPCLSEQIRMVAASGLDSHFTFTGQLADPFFEGVFSASDIICQPSRWQEAFGWVIGEAMAFRKPVVATRVGGIPEIVRDAVTGFLVERRNPADLSRRLIELASDPGLRNQMGAAGCKEVKERFSLDRKIHEHLVLYGLTSLVSQPALHDRAYYVANGNM